MPSGSYTGYEVYLAFGGRYSQRASNSVDAFQYQVVQSNNGPRSASGAIPPRTYTTDPPCQNQVDDFDDEPRSATSRVDSPRTNASGRVAPFQYEVDDFATHHIPADRTPTNTRFDGLFRSNMYLSPQRGSINFRRQTNMDRSGPMAGQDDILRHPRPPSTPRYLDGWIVSPQQIAAEEERAMLLGLHNRPHDIHNRRFDLNTNRLDLYSSLLDLNDRPHAIAGWINTRPGRQNAEVDDEGWQVPPRERNEWDTDPVPAYSAVRPGEAPPPYEP